MKFTTSVSTLFLFLFLFLLTFGSCQKAEKVGESWYLTGPDSLAVVKGVLEATDAWADANIKMDADKAILFWDSSSDMFYADNGEEYTLDSLHAYIKGWYSQPLESVEMKWEKRNVLPLSHYTAHFVGTFTFGAKFKSGQLYRSKAVETGLFLKRGGSWKAFREHESSKVLTNK